MDALLHYSKEPWYGPVKDEYRGGGGFKPSGLWVTIPPGTKDGPSWLEWCKSENYGLGNCKHVSQVVLVKAHNLLLIKSIDDLDNFVKTFMYPKRDVRRDVFGIDWHKVAEKYSGIVIVPYIYRRRFDYIWYYTWDCASGCIWDSNAVRSVEYIGPVEGLDENES